MLNHVNALRRNNTVFMSQEMSLNDVASMNVKQNEVGKKKTISRAPIVPKMQSSSYQRNTYRELVPTNNVFPTLCYP